MAAALWPYNAVGHTPANSVRVRCDGSLLATDSTLGRDFRAGGNNYCDSRTDAGGGRGGAVAACVGPTARCEGEIVRLDAKPAAAEAAAPAAWTVTVVDSAALATAADNEADDDEGGESSEEEEDARVEL